jgi:hypothetical protein
MRRGAGTLYRGARMSDRPTHGERRAGFRVRGQFPFEARTRHARERHDDIAIADNIGSHGAYARLPRALHIDHRLFGLVSLPTGSVVAVRGRVVRVDRLPGGLWGTAVRFTRARMFPDHTFSARDDVRWPGRVHP